jgi:EAL domain-containing protein (putative c-di-GMP-specific phosphodiesterase class I)
MGLRSGPRSGRRLLTAHSYERMFVNVSSDSRLTEDRLASIERAAQERHTLIDRVTLELVEEVRRLREIVAEGLSHGG